jgi:hypothetical protein
MSFMTLMGALNLCLLCPQLCSIFVVGIVIEFVFAGLDGMDGMDGWVGEWEGS